MVETSHKSALFAVIILFEVCTITDLRIVFYLYAPMDRSFPAKILLFGEYTILFGASAVALPYDRFYGRWVHQSLPDQRLIDLSVWIKEKGPGHLLHMEEMQREFKAGRVFESTIPIGYGLGSSGALVAAVWEQYRLKDPVSYDILRTHLGEIEGFFHGNSSGLDPLISFLNRPVLVTGEGKVMPFSSPILHRVEHHFFLLNSHLPRKTAPLVQIFRQLLNNTAFHQAVRKSLVDLNENAISALKHGSYEHLIAAVKSISRTQFDHFKPMITMEVSRFWKAGLENKTYYTKLCGAGGGGFYLVFFEEPSVANKVSDIWDLIPLAR